MFILNIFGEIEGGDRKLELEDVALLFKNLYVKVFILNIFGGIKGGNPNLGLEGVNFPFKNLYVKVFILNIFGEIKGGDPKFEIAQDCTSKKGVFLFFFYHCNMQILQNTC